MTLPDRSPAIEPAASVFARPLADQDTRLRVVPLTDSAMDLSPDVDFDPTGESPEAPPGGATDPDEPDEVTGPLNPAERQRARYIIGLYEELSPAAQVPFPAKAINRLLRRLPGWEYSVEGLSPPVHYLTRQVMGSSAKLDLPKPSAPGRSIHRNDGSVTLRVEGEQPRGKDLITALKIESRYPRHFVRREMEARQNGMPPPSETAAKFRETRGVYLEEGDLFTDTQSFILSQMTHYASQLQLADALEIKSQKLGELMKPLRDITGVQNRPGPEPYIELTLMAIALGLAKTDHLPEAPEAELDSLKPDQRALLAHYYSFDADERASVRAGEDRTEVAISMAWGRVYKKIGISGQNGRHAGMLYAVANDILKIPATHTIRQRLARNAAVRHSYDSRN